MSKIFESIYYLMRNIFVSNRIVLNHLVNRISKSYTIRNLIEKDKERWGKDEGKYMADQLLVGLPYKINDDVVKNRSII